MISEQFMATGAARLTTKMTTKQPEQDFRYLKCQKLHLNILYPVNFLCKITAFFFKYVSISQLLCQTRGQPPESSIGTALVSPEFIAGRSENFFRPRWLTQLQGFDLWAMAVAFFGGDMQSKVV